MVLHLILFRGFMIVILFGLFLFLPPADDIYDMIELDKTA